MPVAPHAAVIPGKYYHTGEPLICKHLIAQRLTTTQAYTEAINLLDYSVVVIPVTKANKDLDKPDSNFTPLNDFDAKNWAACKTPLSPKHIVSAR
jgi:amidase